MALCARVTLASLLLMFASTFGTAQRPQEKLKPGFATPPSFVAPEKQQLHAQQRQPATDEVATNVHRFRGKSPLASDVRAPGAYSKSEFLVTRERTKDSVLRRLVGGAYSPSASASIDLANMPGLNLRPTMPAPRIPTALAVADFNSDGRADYAVPGGLDDEIWVSLGQGDGSFFLPRIVPLTQGVSPIAIKAASIRNNRIIDLVVANSDSNSIGILFGNGDGTFSTEFSYLLPCSPSNLVVADFTGDGKLDIIVSCIDYYILEGDGAGGFAAPRFTGLRLPYGWVGKLLAADLNQDSRADLISVGESEALSALGNGDGTFQAPVTIEFMGPDSYVNDAAVGDVDEDGCLDVAMIERIYGITVAFGNCDGTYKYRAESSYIRTGDSGFSIALTDLDNDGHLDLLAGGYYGGHATLEFSVPYSGTLVSVMKGDGHGVFTNGRVYRGSMDNVGLATADFNSDGFQDVLAVSQFADNTTLFTNDGTGSFGMPEGFVTYHRVLWNSMDFADLNGDGKKDIAYFNTDQSLGVVLNEGKGVFSPPNFYASGVEDQFGIGDFKLGDFRNNGKSDFVGIGLDYYYSGSYSAIIYIPNNGDGTFGAPIVSKISNAYGRITTGDFNGDGNLDFVTAGVFSDSSTADHSQIVFFAGDGKGHFTQGVRMTHQAPPAPMNLYTADFNGDHKLDVLAYYTGNGNWTDGDEVWEFLGNGDGTFQARKLFVAFDPFAVADVNGDGRADIIRSRLDQASSGESQTAKLDVYLAQSDGTFSLTSTYDQYPGYPIPPSPFWQSGCSRGPLAADYNGDGKVDIALFQSNTPYMSRDIYVQFLLGNGDGTFTPTYDVFELHRNGQPAMLVSDLDGDGREDIVEISEQRLSAHMITPAPAPALQLVLDRDRLDGSSARGWVVLNVASDSATTVALTTSDAGVTVPPSITVPAGVVSQEFSLGITPQADFEHLLQVKGRSGVDSAEAFASIDYVVGFEEVITPPSPYVVLRGQTTKPYEVRIRSRQNHGGTVRFQCLGLPYGTTCTFDPPEVTLTPGGEAVSALTFTVSETADRWQINRDVTILASDGVYTKWGTTKISFLAFDFNITSGTVSKSPGSTTQGMLVNGIPPYTFECASSVAIICSLVGDQVFPPQTSSLQLQLSIPDGVAPGRYGFTVTGTSLDQHKSVSSNFVVEPPADFRMTNFGSVTLFAGDSAGMYTWFDSLYGFSGLLTLTCTAPSGITCTVPAELGVPDRGTSLYPSITTAKTLAAGDYSVTLSANSGTLQHSIDYKVTVIRVDASFPAGTDLTVKVGTPSIFQLKITASAGATGTMYLQCQGSSVIACGFNPNPIALTPGSESTVQLQLNAYSVGATRSARIPTKSITPVIFCLLGVFCFIPPYFRRIPKVLPLLVLAFALMSCGGGSGSTYNPPPPQPPTSSTQTLNIIDGSNSNRVLATLTVTVRSN